MNKYNVATIIDNYLIGTDQVLSQDQLIVLAKKIREPMWNWHIYLGYLLTALFSLRLILPLFGEMKFQTPFDKNMPIKDRFKNLTYLIFYACVFISLITGLIIELGPKELKDSMETIHEPSIYYLIGFIIIHWTGVLVAEFTDEKGIISRMIRGSTDGYHFWVHLEKLNACLLSIYVQSSPSKVCFALLGIKQHLFFS